MSGPEVACHYSFLPLITITKVEGQLSGQNKVLKMDEQRAMHPTEIEKKTWVREALQSYLIQKPGHVQVLCVLGTSMNKIIHDFVIYMIIILLYMSTG